MDIAKKTNIQITSKQLNKVWMLFDEINHIMSLIIMKTKIERESYL